MSKAVGKLRRRGGDSVTDAALHRNTQYSKPVFHQVGHAPVPHIPGSSRAGQQYRIGLTPDGRVVHLYQDGTRIVLPKASKAAISNGEMAAPHPDDARFISDSNKALLAAQASKSAKHVRNAVQDAAAQAALQQALAAFSGH